MDEMRELTGGWLEEFSESWSEMCPCQTQASWGDDFFCYKCPQLVMEDRV